MTTSPNRSSVEGPRPGPLNRRAFLAQATLAAGGAALAFSGPGCATARRSAERPLVGSQLYGWGQYYQRDGKPYRVEEILSALRDAGYDYAEGSLDVAHPENNALFAGQLRERGLQPVSLYTGGRLHESASAAQSVERIIAAARVARQAGFTILNCNPDPIGRDKTDAELKTQSGALEALGRGLQAIDMQLGIHHHTPEMRQQGREFHANFRHTPAGLVGFCYDVHWVYRGGVQPADALREYGNRIVSWHLRQSRGQIWWEDLAPGDIDYAAIAKHAREHRIPPRYTVELAIESGTRITRSAVENHARSRQFVRDVFHA